VSTGDYQALAALGKDAPPRKAVEKYSAYAWVRGNQRTTRIPPAGLFDLPRIGKVRAMSINSGCDAFFLTQT
jgi:hypothetical protein